MVCFLCFGPVFGPEAIADFGRDAGALRSGIDLYDKETCAGEKPLTMLVALCSDAASVDPVAFDFEEACDALDVDGACFSSGAEMKGDATLLSFAADFGWSGARYECVLSASGSRSFFSLIVMTIFSRSSGVICLSRPLLLVEPES